MTSRTSECQCAALSVSLIMLCIGVVSFAFSQFFLEYAVFANAMHCLGNFFVCGFTAHRNNAFSWTWLW